MQKINSIILILVFIFLVNCSSSTTIESIPSGAKLYLDGAYVGKTPYRHTDSKPFLSWLSLKLKKEGCEDLKVVITKTEDFRTSACIAAPFTVFVSLFWIMGYYDRHTYELDCDGEKEKSENLTPMKVINYTPEL